MSLAVAGVDFSHELTLVPSASGGGLRWERTRVFDRVKDGKLFAPGNLRCAQVSRILYGAYMYVFYIDCFARSGSFWFEAWELACGFAYGSAPAVDGLMAEQRECM